MHSYGRHEILGTAYSDHDLVVFLEGAGVVEPKAVLDDSRWVEWRGGHAHEFHAAWRRGWAGRTCCARPTAGQPKTVSRALRWDTKTSGVVCS